MGQGLKLIEICVHLKEVFTLRERRPKSVVNPLFLAEYEHKCAVKHYDFHACQRVLKCEGIRLESRISIGTWQRAL